jgi:hypothetical protein
MKMAMGKDLPVWQQDGAKPYQADTVMDSVFEDKMLTIKSRRGDT